MKIGFIGLGIMGRPMAKNLITAGYRLTVYNKSAKLEDLVALGAKRANSIRDVARQSEVIITMLPDSPHVKEVVLGKDGIMECAKNGTILVDMSSIAPAVSQEICRILKEKDIIMLDAPVSGGEPKAIDGTLSIMVGGDEKAFETVKSILEKMGTSVVRVGDIGSGNVAKLANQIIVALNIAAVSEAFALAVKAGVNPENVFNAIKGGLAGGAVMNAKVPMILDGNFKPGFRVELHIKDLGNALDTAIDLGAPVPLTTTVMEILQAVKADGMAANDHSAVARYYEKLAGIEIRR